MRLLAFLFGQNVWKIYSLFVRQVLLCKGVQVGQNFYIEGTPILKINGKPGNIVIGHDVKIIGDVDIRNKQNGRIHIGDRCKIDQGVRLVAANDAVLSIGEETNIGAYSIFNCGTDVTIGKKCLISGFVYIQSSNHGMKCGVPIKDQDHTHAPIVIGDDVWLGSHVSVLAGAKIGSGAIIGSKAVVTAEIEANAVAVGIPAKKMRLRD